MSIGVGVGVGRGRAGPSAPAPAFTPADLFGAGELGVFVDVNSSLLYTDAAATTIAAVGQSVAVMLDLSPNGLDFVQPTAAARPILRQDANGKKYLEFDGVDDRMVTNANVGIFGSQAREIQIAAGSGFAASMNPFATAFGWRYTLRDDRGSLRVEIEGTGFTSSLAVNQSYVYGVRHEFGQPLSGSRLYRGAASANNSDLSTVDTTNSVFAIGVIRSGVFTAYNLYGVFLISRVLTDTERADTQNYLAAQAGITL